MSIFYTKNGEEREIRLRCSYRLTLLPLRELASLCGLERTPFPYKVLYREFRRVEKLSSRDFETEDLFKSFVKRFGRIIDFHLILENYCSNEALIVKRGVKKFLLSLEKIFKLPKKLPLTASSLSLMIFFSSKTKIKRSLKLIDDDLIRRSYYGGRCEVFGNLDFGEIALHFDFTGMYASCMSEEVPSGEYKIIEVDQISLPGFY